MIEVQGLHKRYGGRVALDQLDFAVPEGEIFGFLGPNGAGKTTTIRILATLTPADGGTATIDGVRIDRQPYAVRRLIGYMPDFFGVYDRLSVVEYLDFYAGCYDVPAARRQRVTAELLELVDLADRAGDDVDSLSRGMKQRLCLARALVHEPRVLLLDEPASGLDPRACLEMQELIRELRRMGKTILISSHIVPEVEELCTWVGVIDAGRMVEIGPKAEVLDRVAGARRLRIELARADEARTEAARRLLLGWPGVLDVEERGAGLVATVDAGLQAHELLGGLVKAGMDVSAFSPVEADLSDVFLRLTERDA